MLPGPPANIQLPQPASRIAINRRTGTRVVKRTQAFEYHTIGPINQRWIATKNDHKFVQSVLIPTDRARIPITIKHGPGPLKGTRSTFCIAVTHQVDVVSVAVMFEAGEDCAGRSGIGVG